MDSDSESVESVESNETFLNTLNLKEIIIKSQIICIKCEHLCKCYKKNSRIPEFFICKSNINGVITNQDLLNSLVGYIPCRKHNILSSFVRTTDVQLLAIFN